MKIIVTGGAGYIGSEVVKKMVSKKHTVIVIDDFSTSSEDALLNLDVLTYKTDIRNINEMKRIFSNHSDTNLVMDFAAKLIVEESYINPALYYDVNVLGLKVILDLMCEYKIKNIVFSSTAAVYGMIDKKNALITETDITTPCNPYGNTKLLGEKMIEDYSRKYNFNYIIFRYFNVVGGRKIGSKLSELTAILPRIIYAVIENKTLEIFGDTYSTQDGTCIRDFIHVEDLSQAHVSIIGSMNENTSGIYNLSIGKGTSILELISIAEKVIGKKVPYKFSEKRAGDPMISAASNEKFINTFNWEIKYSRVSDMIQETYNNWKK